MTVVGKILRQILCSLPSSADSLYKPSLSVGRTYDLHPANDYGKGERNLQMYVIKAQINFELIEREIILGGSEIIR